MIITMKTIGIKFVAVFTLLFGCLILGPFWLYKSFTSNNYMVNIKAWHDELKSGFFTKPLYWSFWILFDKDESKIGW